MNTRLIISLLCAGALAFACGPRPHSGEAPAAIASVAGAAGVSQAGSPATRTADANRVERSSKKNGKEKADAKLDSKLNVYVAQSDVRIAFDLRNVGGKHAELTFPTGQSYDFVVVDSIGKEVWRWSNHRMFTSGVQNKQLGAGESMQLEETWKDGVKPGRYTAIATLRSTNFPVEQRVEFVMH